MEEELQLITGEKNYTPPQLETTSVTLEQCIAAGSATVNLYDSQKGVQEVWTTDQNRDETVDW
ncbi:hypothetical protein KRE47_08940 [Elizabethkingia meningoseptica]|uniref:hypothetical protein n=1 Tax=Elizabethkingia meningoseptica TaxID=238 RepID=UPI0022F16A5B|nr:hypothetical protein [Elizabethkingia meningoseptica]EJK5330500.1 hypothetical protein [Elizabethkingia meningoseptica]MDE5469163.1 hypothetical protein [Elizabethkingia meningoseptica]MDE5475077.1 hypothetical protein [Elizabethkingia meningoseptica]MDE5478510.1 hypothetical protein [Elizabethkingia meningoseptica]MDE5486204.1 hypothetical protein [Elizabethkingia meningoseptica]